MKRDRQTDRRKGEVIQEIHIVARSSQTRQANKPKPPAGWTNAAGESSFISLSQGMYWPHGGCASVTFTKSFVN